MNSVPLKDTNPFSDLIDSSSDSENDYSEDDYSEYDEYDVPESLFDRFTAGELEDVPLERKENTYHFRGDTFFTSFMRDLHDLKDGRFVNFYRLFSKTDSLFHDDDITDMIISNYDMTKELKYILSLHPQSTITCAIKIDPSETPREPVNLSPYHTIIYPSFPSNKMTGLFHPNILMIRFSDRLRIVFSSAYIHVWDWEELTNWIWMQDFFIKPNQPTAVKKLDKEFRYNLIDFLLACQYPKDRVFRILKNVCFENVSVRMVTSLPGRFSPREAERYGRLRLRTIVNDLNTYYDRVTNHPVREVKPVICQSNALGFLAKPFIRDIISSCNGGKMINGDVNDLFQIAYPSKDDVFNAIMYHIPVNMRHNARNYQEGTISQSCLRKYVPTEGRERSLPRSHILFTAPDEENRISWVYGGTHNITQAAWGRLQKWNHFRFYMNNYELGLVLLPKNYVDYHNGELKKGEWNERMIENDFVKGVDLGFQLPLMEFSGDERAFFWEDLDLSEDEENDNNDNKEKNDNDELTVCLIGEEYIPMLITFYEKNV